MCGSSILLISVRSIGVITSISFIISLFSFYLKLSFSECGVLKCPNINLWVSVYDLIFSNVSFTNVGILAFGA